MSCSYRTFPYRQQPIYEIRRPVFGFYFNESHFSFCISNFSFSSPLRVWIFQQVRLLCNPFQPFLFLLRQLPIVQFEPLADKGHRSLFRVAVWAGGFFGGLQEIFQRIVLRDTEKIVLVGFPQVKGYLVYILLYHMAAKAVIVNVGGDQLP